MSLYQILLAAKLSISKVLKISEVLLQFFVIDGKNIIIIVIRQTLDKITNI